MTEECKQLWKRMADMTRPLCMCTGNEGLSWAEKRAQGLCMNPGSCCDSMYCDLALETAEEMGEPLARTTHPTLPLMGPDGCVAPPHVRRLCTLHACCINNLGFKPGDEEWTNRYFELREQVLTRTHEEESGTQG